MKAQGRASRKNARVFASSSAWRMPSAQERITLRATTMQSWPILPMRSQNGPVARGQRNNRRARDNKRRAGRDRRAQHQAALRQTNPAPATKAAPMQAQPLLPIAAPRAAPRTRHWPQSAAQRSNAAGLPARARLLHSHLRRGVIAARRLPHRLRRFATGAASALSGDVALPRRRDFVRQRRRWDARHFSARRRGSKRNHRTRQHDDQQHVHNHPHVRAWSSSRACGMRASAHALRNAAAWNCLPRQPSPPLNVSRTQGVNP